MLKTCLDLIIPDTEDFKTFSVKCSLTSLAMTPGSKKHPTAAKIQNGKENALKLVSLACAQKVGSIGFPGILVRKR